VSLFCSSLSVSLPEPVEHDLHHSHGVVVKYGGDIFGGELVGCVGDEQASLTDGTVADDDTPRRGRLA
jgi:hypothetical protein